MNEKKRRSVRKQMETECKDGIAVFGRILPSRSTALLLKRTFGKGHTLSLLSEPEDASRVADIVGATQATRLYPCRRQR